MNYFTPHDLRRTFITQLLEQGSRPQRVRQLAGHADIATTTRYDHRGRGTQDRTSGLSLLVNHHGVGMAFVTCRLNSEGPGDIFDAPKARPGQPQCNGVAGEIRPTLTP